ncbi:M15 family metallopeptidase [Paenibacillus pasadenensis]|uniref:M15 family metallopeptidase n=1 Tax=Paenibacillus pasadenensis TaxID=217090 RepID=UPI00203FB62C|nr:M15 family metallopeptidase [Paenibacillus pasadenensis]MCM3749537.1 M15 family metallopeptidase [Paenibacillus pasadenensis]
MKRFTTPVKSSSSAWKRSLQRRIGWVILTLGLLAANIAIVKMELPSVFDKIISPSLYKEVPAVSEIHPKVAIALTQLYAQAQSIGIQVVYNGGLRSYAEQDKLYEQGRSKAGRIVTNDRGGDSYHNYGLAVDFVLIQRGNLDWNMNYDGNRNGKSDWKEVIELANKLGFTMGSGGKEYPDHLHLQMDFGYSIRQLKNGLRPPGSVLEDGTISER